MPGSPGHPARPTGPLSPGGTWPGPVRVRFARHNKLRCTWRCQNPSVPASTWVFPPLMTRALVSLVTTLSRIKISTWTGHTLVSTKFESTAPRLKPSASLWDGGRLLLLTPQGGSGGARHTHTQQRTGGQVIGRAARRRLGRRIHVAAFAAPVKDGIGCKFEGLVCIDDRQPLGATGLGFARYRHSAMAGASAGCVVALALRSPGPRLFSESVPHRSEPPISVGRSGPGGATDRPSRAPTELLRTGRYDRYAGPNM